MNKPPSMRRPNTTVRRDDRSEPDDDVEPVERVDVVAPNSPSPSGNVLVNIRRELARLSQQAAAVERTIEQQSRDKEETGERLTRANDRITLLEARLANAESETHSMRRLHESALDDLAKMRDERDDLAKQLDDAKTSNDELARARAEVERLRAELEESSKASSALDSQLSEVRKKQLQEELRVTDKEGELEKLKASLEAADTAAQEAKREVERARSDLTKAKFEAVEAREAGNKARDELTKLREAMTKRTEELEKELAEERTTRDDTMKALRNELADLQVSEADVRTVNTRLKRELEAASTERESAETMVARLEGEIAEAKLDVERMRKELEDAVAATGQAESRCASAERAHALLTQSMFDLREQMAHGFSRAGIGGAPGTSQMAMPAVKGPPPLPKKD